MSHKATWTGPRLAVKDPAFRAVNEDGTLNRGDEFEIPDGIILAGEDVNYEITGGPEHDALTKEAQDLDIKGRSKLKTRKQLAEAVAAARAEAAEEKAAPDTDQEA